MFNFDCIACLAAENTLEKTAWYRLFLFVAFYRGRIEIETEPDWIQIQIRFCFLYRSDASASYQAFTADRKANGKRRSRVMCLP